MLGLGLKLLGVGKFLKDFFLQNWKWLLPVLLAIAAFIWTKDHYYNAGINKERVTWEAKLEKERKKNEKLTAGLLNSVNNFGKLAEKENSERISKEVIRENRINTIIEEKPIYKECKVDQEVLDELNALKALGPKQ
jgi:hypothetical protein